jgi:hypothetical protein
VTFLTWERHILELTKEAFLMTAFSKTKPLSILQVIFLPLKPPGLAAIEAAVMFWAIIPISGPTNFPPLANT